MSTARSIRLVYDRALATLDINVSEASVLAALGNEGSMTQTELAARVGTSRARIGVYVDTLEAKGAAVRAADPEDRRVWLVSLTPIGHDLWSESVVIDRAVRAGLRKGTTSDERRMLDSVLQVIRSNCADMLSS